MPELDLVSLGAEEKILPDLRAVSTFVAQSKLLNQTHQILTTSVTLLHNHYLKFGYFKFILLLIHSFTREMF